MIDKIKRFIVNIFTSIAEIASNVFFYVRSLFIKEYSSIEREMQIIKENNKQIIPEITMKPPTITEKITETITNTIDLGVILYEFTNAFSNYLLRFATDRKTTESVRKYIRMDRIKRLIKMNKLLIKEGFGIAGIKIDKETINYLSNIMIKLYENAIDGLPIYEEIEKIFEDISGTTNKIMLIGCTERRCQDAHIAMYDEKHNRINFIKFGKATNLDLSTYASNRNFAKIAVISQLEFCNMFAVKEIIIMALPNCNIIESVNLTIHRKKICSGILLKLHNQMVINHIEFNNFHNKINRLTVKNQNESNQLNVCQENIAIPKETKKGHEINDNISHKTRPANVFYTKDSLNKINIENNVINNKFKILNEYMNKKYSIDEQNKDKENEFDLD